MSPISSPISSQNVTYSWWQTNQLQCTEKNQIHGIITIPIPINPVFQFDHFMLFGQQCYNTYIIIFHICILYLFSIWFIHGEYVNYFLNICFYICFLHIFPNWWLIDIHNFFHIIYIIVNTSHSKICDFISKWQLLNYYTSYVYKICSQYDVIRIYITHVKTKYNDITYKLFIYMIWKTFTNQSTIKHTCAFQRHCDINIRNTF